MSYPLQADVEVLGEPLPFVSFYETTRERVARALALTLGDGHLAAEAVDEAMARAYQRWGTVGRYENPGGWVYRVALNWATSALRRRKRQPTPPAERGPLDVPTMGEPDVLAALAELDVRQRSVVVCRFYLGMSEAETAAALGTRPGTVKSRLHRALRHLQTRLSHLSPEEN
jgi:RNA polymerase sigma-70 factor (ECF subfamily)